ncbi:MAG: N-acetylneuraminate synthase, partial [Proteobacteria bacterium]
HNGDIKKALRLVDIAAEAGADAIKFQTFKSESVISAIAEKAEYQKDTTGAGETMLEMAKKLELSYDEFKTLSAHCEKRNIRFISSPFDLESAKFLIQMGVKIVKLGSGELTNSPLVKYLANQDVLLVLSTGMSHLGEIEEAVSHVQAANRASLVLLHCVSSYPAEANSINLRAMDTMRKAFQIPVGYSDHCMGNEVAFASVALGACVLEKHFTESSTQEGPDHAISLEPSELVALVSGIRRIESALGTGIKRPHVSELKIRDVARKSIVAKRNLDAGMRLDDSMLEIKRPGTGISPSKLPELLGRTLKNSVSRDHLITLEDLN